MMHLTNVYELCFTESSHRRAMRRRERTEMVEPEVVLYTYPEDTVMVVPTRAYEDDTGFDLACSDNIILKRGVPTKIPTKIRICPPPDIWCRIIGRSSTIWRYNVQILEGVIDTGWRGELFIVAIYHGPEPSIVMEKHTRLAQLIFQKRVDVQFKFVDQLPESARGTRGFGSSGE